MVSISYKIERTCNISDLIYKINNIKQLVLLVDSRRVSDAQTDVFPK